MTRLRLLTTCLLLGALGPRAQQPPTPQPTAPAPQPTPPALPKLTYAIAIDRAGELVPAPPAAHWLPGGHALATVQTGADHSQQLVRLQPGEKSQPIAEARKALAALEQPLAADKPALFPSWSWADANTLRLQLDGALWHWQPATDKAVRVLSWPAKVDSSDGHPVLAVAPADQRLACVVDHELCVIERNGSSRRISWDGSGDIVYGGAAHRAEFGIDSGLFWSHDGKLLAFYREDQREVAPYPYQDLRALPPQPLGGRYPMAGRLASRVQVGVFDSADASLHWLESDAAADLYWTNITFAADDKTLVVAQINRGQDRLQLVRFDAHTGRRLALLLEEQDPQWVEPEHGPTFLPDGRFVWWSPRDGRRHLYLYDTDGKLLLQITRGAFDVQEVLGFTPDHAGLYFQASGEDPRQRHLFVAKLDGTEVKQLTRERGTHACTLSPDGQFAFDLWSNQETPPTEQFLNLQTAAPDPLPALPNPLQQFQLGSQRLFQIKAEDESVLYGHLILPPELQEGRKYPVLLYVYGGPHVQLVTDRWLGNAPLWLHGLAAEGYVVCALDNRGTPNRGIEFEQCIHRRLGTLEVQDQLRAVEWLKQQPFVDPARIGVHGWSYGGYMTLRLLLLAPDTFACGVAGAPVTDWAMYETGYGERYMDTPAENPDGYAASSCLPLAGKLKAKLLLVHGTDDKTVMWSNSLAFVDRCIDAGVQLEYFPYPMQTHRLVGKDKRHFLLLLKSFLDRNLRPGS